MKKDFWLERWEKEEIGFHQDDYNPYLREYWQQLQLARGSLILVPLCGKSRDMIWLNSHGFPVLGVELSGIAAKAFFDENGLTPQCSAHGKFDSYESGGIHILCGDFFDLDRAMLENVGAVYDRASLIALPPEMRERYISHMAGILPPGTRILLITLDYDEEEMQGPPFAVSKREVQERYGRHAKVALLAEIDALHLERNARFLQRGLSRLQECVFLVELR
ncbi:MAG: thiopurine S-methyltransferase [Burkholderiales bacterium]